MQKTTCVVLGGKQIGVNGLRLLLKYGVRPEFVVCNLDDKGEDFSWHESLARVATEAGVEVVTGKKIKDPEIVQKIVELGPEVIFHLGGLQIIPSEVIASAKLGCLNIHPAALPKYRGRFSTMHAVFNGETEHGVTVHWMDKGLDTGPIIMQEMYPIGPDDTAKDVYDGFTRVGTKLFDAFLELWLSGKEIVATPQDESQATYYPKGLPNDGKLDWSWSGEQIRNFIRAMTFEPFPPADFMLGEKRMVIADEKFFTKDL